MRHVWLPALCAWAHVQEHSITASTCQGLESRADSSMAAACSNGEWSSAERKRRPRHDHSHSSLRHHQSQHNNRPHGGGRHDHNSCHHKSCTECHYQIDALPHCEHSDEPGGNKHHHDWHDGSRRHDEHQDHPQKPSHTCPICLSPISQSSLTVLCWCMHRFCITCIEKWSRMQRFCPLCKQIFHGWYYDIKSPSVFDKKDLAAKSSLQTSRQLHRRGRRDGYPVSRRPISLSVRTSKPLPWRRDFRFPRTTTAHSEVMIESTADEAALQWRASVYKKNWRAVPLHVNSKVKIKQASSNDLERKARIERRLEPWICRELQAIMEDSDPSLVVCLALSLWLHTLSEREKIVESRNSGHQHDRVQMAIWDSEAIRQLEPFLQEKASIFWHELNCFAESPFSLRTYDCVTKYEKCRG